jgi:uncharacterized protein
LRRVLAGLGVLVVGALSSALPSAHALDRVPPNTGAIVDVAGLLSSEQEAEVLDIMAEGRSQGTVVINVLTINRMADWDSSTSSIQSFSQEVFDAWGIGDPSTNNGALVVVSKGDREAHIELGAGFAGRYNTEMRTVMSEIMVPRFREDNYGVGIVNGTRRMVELLRGEPASSQASSGEASSDQASSDQASGQPVSSPSTASPKTSDDSGSALVGALVLGGATVAVGGGTAAVLAKRRRRRCARCGSSCRLLNEIDDDVYLNDGQRCEEFLRSVNYKAWRCMACSNVELTQHRRLLNRTKVCATCHFRTATTSQQTITSASYSSSGTALVTVTCLQPKCRATSQHQITLPQLTESSSSSSSSGRSSGRSSSSFSRRSGGGRSGGGGASGKW